MAIQTLEEAIYDRLSNFTGLTDLVSTKIYPLEIPQDIAKPAVVYARDVTEHISAFGADIGNVRVVMEVVAWAETYSSALAICKQIRLALQRWSGTYGSIIVEDTFVESEAQSFESDTEGKYVSQTYIMWFRS